MGYITYVFYLSFFQFLSFFSSHSLADLFYFFHMYFNLQFLLGSVTCCKGFCFYSLHVKPYIPLITGYHLLVPFIRIEKQLQTPQTAEQVKSQSHKINA